MKYEAVIADIDGTLVRYQPTFADLSKADALIRESTIDAVNRLHNIGIKVVAMTGRTFEQSKDILVSLGIEGPCAFAGGATIRLIPSGDILHESSLESKTVQIVFDSLFSVLGNEYPIECAPSETNTGLYNSLWIIVDKNKVTALSEKLSLLDEIYFVVNDGAGKEHESGVLVLNKDADKGTGTKRLQTLLKTTRANTACVGDGANDVLMFRECGLSVAMGNGEEVLKNVADHVVASIEEDGFAEAVDIIVSSK